MNASVSTRSTAVVVSACFIRRNRILYGLNPSVRKFAESSIRTSLTKTPTTLLRCFTTTASPVLADRHPSYRYEQFRDIHARLPFQHQLMKKRQPYYSQRRMLARSSQSESDSNDPIVKARNFLLRLNYSPEIADGVIDALKQSGMSGTSLLSMVRSLAGRWEVGEDNGLEDLVDSVKLQLARNQGRKPITLHVIPGNAWKSSEEDAPDFSNIQETNEEFDKAMTRSFVVEAQTGLTLTDIAKFGDGAGASELGEMIECACAGIMACSTCHVVVDPNWFELVGEPSEAEQVRACFLRNCITLTLRRVLCRLFGKLPSNPSLFESKTFPYNALLFLLRLFCMPHCLQQDMLDLAYAPRATSRLGCQIQLEESMDGMIIRLPRGSNNLMDDIPFEG